MTTLEKPQLSTDREVAPRALVGLIIRGWLDSPLIKRVVETWEGRLSLHSVWVYKVFDGDLIGAHTLHSECLRVLKQKVVLPWKEIPMCGGYRSLLR